MNYKNFIIIIFLLIIPLGIYAQNILGKTVSLEADNIPLIQILKSLAEQTGGNFAYDPRKIPIQKKYTISVNKITLKETLKTLFVGTEITFDAANLQISIYRHKIPIHTISGYIKDAKTGEPLIGANVFHYENHIGTTTNNYGHYSLSLPEGQHPICISYIGFTPKIDTIEFYQNGKKSFLLKSGEALEEILVLANPIADSSELTLQQVSNFNPSRTRGSQADKLPLLLGESDMLKVIQFWPGIQAANEGTTGLVVRGGSTGQNLVLLDGAPVYNLNHLFGLFSILESNVVNHSQLFKGGFPAKYGGRISSILDVRLKEGNTQKLHGQFGMGLISANLLLEGPIGKRMSFLISGRRTWLDLILSPLVETFSDSQLDYYFYDINGKINIKLSERDHLYLGYYGGDDSYSTFASISSTTLSTQSWGNKVASLRWTRAMGDQWFSNMTLFNTHFTNSFSNTAAPIDTSEVISNIFNAKIRDYGWKWDLDYTPRTNHYYKFGAGLFIHDNIPVEKETERIVNGAIVSKGTQTSFRNTTPEGIIYGDAYFDIYEKIKLHIGLRMSGFIESTDYWGLVQPRISVSYIAGKKTQISASYSSMGQFIHQLTSPSVLGNPNDLWVPSEGEIGPETSNIYTLGINHKLKGIHISTELFYKKLNNVLEFKAGQSTFQDAINWQDEVQVGNGMAYGTEIIIEKKTGRATGWLSYTLSRSMREFKGLNKGEPFPFRYDRRHELSATFHLKLNKKWDFGSVFVYASGNPVTIGNELYAYHGNFSGYPAAQPDIIIENNKNNFRLSHYHRLDISFNRTKIKKNREKIWKLGIYNLYGRPNPTGLYYQFDYGENKVLFYESTLIGFPLPYISYSFRF